ncbi:MAG: universal stress protein [Thermoleophilia bacterium]|nr:universal stress protein [Thermoleophilia bacterium]
MTGELDPEDTMPAPYSRIACFIDEDPASAAVRAEAVALRAQSPGELHLVHIATTPWPLYGDMYGVSYPLEETLAAARAWIADQAAEVPGSVPVLLEGWAPGVACAYLRREGIDLAVAAAHRGRVERTLLGGFAGYIAYHSPCAVLLVRPAAEDG